MKNLLLAFFVIGVFAAGALAGGPQVWTVNSRSDILKGDADGVAIASDGTLTVAPRLTLAFDPGEPFIWSAAADSVGNVYLGTGSGGKLFRVDPTGKGAVLATFTELNVSAIAIAPGGDTFAATMPDGKVYKVDRSGAASVYFDPPDKYIWALKLLPDGSLAVATGDSGKIYKVRAAGASPEASLFYDSSDSHIISLATDRSGSLYAGTDPGGIVLKLTSDGKAFALMDSPLREIHALSFAADGTLYALAIGESASTVKAAETTEKPAAAAADKPLTVEPPSISTETAKSRYDLSAAKSAVYRIAPDWSNDLLWASPSVIGFAVEADNTSNSVLIGTSDKGRIYRIAGDRSETLLQQSTSGQISGIFAEGGRLFATSSNPGRLYTMGASNAAEGTYTSPVLDAKASAVWGKIWWRSAGDVSLQTRSGNTEQPDTTWSTWSTLSSDAKGTQISSPQAKYIQWRATLRGGSASLSEVDLSFLATNIPPEVLSFSVLPTNVALIANPAAQTDPNIDLSGMDPALFGQAKAVVAPRRVYQRAATALQWTAEDRNGDDLRYDLYYRTNGDRAWRLLRADISDTFYTIDGQTLADGHYEFRVVARDTPSNPADRALSGDRISDPVDIDNTPPTVVLKGTPAITGRSQRLTYDAAESSSYISRAEYSVNAGPWMPVYPTDGIADSARETFAIDVTPAETGETSVTFRVYDVNGNSATIRTVLNK